MNNQREAFEAWYEREMHESQFPRGSRDEYLDDYTEYAWCGYQAALASQSQQQKGESLEKLLDDFQELNMGNYDDDAVRHLNNWAIDAYAVLQSQAQQPNCQAILYSCNHRKSQRKTRKHGANGL